jgi:hypothetical protein
MIAKPSRAAFARAEVALRWLTIEVGGEKVTKIIRIAMAILACCFGISQAHADCSSAVSSYNSTLSDIDSYLKRYARCVAASSGTDDCSSEFRRLRSAQGDFESAVSDYQSYCRR